MVKKENPLVAHDDLDGIISAVLAMRKYGFSLKDTEVVFVQPFTVDRVVIPDSITTVVVVDVAVNNRDPEMTKNFLGRIGDRLLVWYDHHQGWTADITFGFSARAFQIDFGRGSCAEVIGGPPKWVADAITADTRKGILSEWAELVEWAIKANQADDSVRLLAVRWILLGEESARNGLESAAKRYAEVRDETQRLVSGLTITGKVAVVDARESRRQYDLTQVLLAGQELAPFVLVIQRGGVLAIATSRGDVDMVEMFGLVSGARFRVSLPDKRLEEALAKLETV